MISSLSCLNCFTHGILIISFLFFTQVETMLCQKMMAKLMTINMMDVMSDPLKVDQLKVQQSKLTYLQAVLTELSKI